MKNKALGLLLVAAMTSGGIAFAQDHEPKGGGHMEQGPPVHYPPPTPAAPAPARVDPIAPAIFSEWHKGPILYRTFRSPEYWSGEGKNFSDWYYVTSGPAPEGYRIAEIYFSLQGDRRCSAWAECALAGQDASVVTWKFRMQGHDENLVLSRWLVDDKGVTFTWVGRKATSVGYLTIGYAPTT